MGREIGWEDETIAGSYNDNERKFRGKKGTTFVIRVMTGVTQYRRHEVDDVLDPGKDGEARVFSMNCSRVWSEKEQEYTGECKGCDREYTIKDRYVAGVLVVGKYVGRSETAKKIDPDESPHPWDFGGDKYRKLSDINLSLKRAGGKRKLRDLELMVSCEDESFQKLNILKCDSDHTAMTKRDHVTAWKEQGKDLVDEAQAPTPKKEWERRLKKKKRKRSRDDDNRDDDRDRDRDRDEKPRREARRSDSDDDRGGGGNESTGDAEIDDLLGELED